MSVIMVTPPAVEPVSLTLAKAHLRLDSDLSDQDEVVELLITVARERAEHMLGRALITQTLTVRQRLLLTPPPSLPYQYQTLPGILYDRPGQMPVADIPIPRVSRDTLQSIVSATLYAEDGTATTLDPSTDWVLNYENLIPRLMLNNPTVVYDIEVTYVAGYGDAPCNVPAGIRRWMLFYINTLYENREAVVIGMTVNPIPNEFVDGLLDPYLIPGVF